MTVPVSREKIAAQGPGRQCIRNHPWDLKLSHVSMTLDMLAGKVLGSSEFHISFTY
jgi:hypothetical protein